LFAILTDSFQLASKKYLASFLKCIPAIIHRDLTTGCSISCGWRIRFFLKSQIPINSPSKSGREEVGDNIDRCISIDISDLKNALDIFVPDHIKVLGLKAYWYTDSTFTRSFQSIIIIYHLSHSPPVDEKNDRSIYTPRKRQAKNKE